tara:strand:+ start:5504 stop:5983 length:480 start_codon:yes stop_codon:yes gene_type:complete
MKKLILLSSLLIFGCSNDDNIDNSEVNLIELLKGKVYQKEIPGGARYVYFDLSYLGENDIGNQYEGWTCYEKYNDSNESLDCFLTESISSIDYGLYLQWYTDTIINTPEQFKLDGIYNQTWIITKDENDIISIEHNYSFDVDNGYTEMSLEEFTALNCL